MLYTQPSKYNPQKTSWKQTSFCGLFYKWCDPGEGNVGDITAKHRAYNWECLSDWVIKFNNQPFWDIQHRGPCSPYKPCNHIHRMPESIHKSLARYQLIVAEWYHKSESTLAQVMACCLTAPSHYLNQCWLTISEVLWHSQEGDFTGKFSHFIDGLVQERRNSSALAMELCLSCTKSLTHQYILHMSLKITSSAIIASVKLRPGLVIIIHVRETNIFPEIWIAELPDCQWYGPHASLGDVADHPIPLANQLFIPLTANRLKYWENGHHSVDDIFKIIPSSSSRIPWVGKLTGPVDSLYNQEFCILNSLT